MTEEQFSEKYFMYHEMIYNIGYTYLHDKNETNDLVQEVFLKFLNANKLSTLVEEKYWLIRVTINQAISMLRKSYKKKVVLNNDYIENIPSSKNNKQKMFEFICSLPEKYKNVIILYYYENLMVKEISQALKISESAVKKQLERGRKILKEKMEFDYDDR